MKKIHFHIILQLLLAVLFMSICHADVTLEWDADKESDIAGYKIYYDTDSEPPYSPAESDWADEGPPPIIVGSDVTKITLHGLTDTKEYFFAITSFNVRGVESSHSTKVSIPHRAASLIFRPLETVIVTADSLNMRSGPRVTTKSLKMLKKGTKVKVIKCLKRWLQVSRDGQTGYISKQYVHKAQQTQQTQQTQPEESLLIYPGDILKIEVPGQEEMSRNYDVDPKGNIYLLTIGKVQVYGLDLTRLNDKLTKKFKKYIAKGEKISVRMLEHKRYIYIQGGVRYPGWYRVPQSTNLDDLIETAGGLLSGADYSRVKLRRRIEEGYKELGIKGKITLHPNDIIEVPFPKTYREKIDKGDLLFVSIPQRQAPSRRSDTRDSADLSESFTRNKIEVDGNGYIYIPDYGHIYANNLTPEEIKKEIEARLPKYIAALLKVAVSIIQKKHYVQIAGHLGKPGRYNIPETANIQTAITTAGGAVDGAIMSDIVISRKLRDHIQRIKVNLYQYIITGDDRLLTPIHEDDTIFVPISSSFGNVKRTLMAWSPPTERLEKEIKTKVRIFGAVNNPGIYELIEGMNLMDLLILASGETHGADLSKIMIIRNNKIEKRYNLEDFLSEEGPPLKIPEIQAGDTIYVNFVELTTFEPKEEELFYITGKVRGPGQYKLWDQMTVLQAIALAGGLDEWADSEHIMIVRWAGGKQENISFNYEKGVEGKSPELNIYLQGRDVIVVP